MKHRLNLLILALLGIILPQRLRTELLTPPPAGLLKAAAKDSLPQVRIDKFRFAKRKGEASERLVLEFALKNKKDKAPKPEVKLSPHPSGKEVTIYLNGLSISGAIPESSINDSFVVRSQLLGPISISSDDPIAPLAFRLFFKVPGAATDAFWLPDPMRLVLDVARDATSLTRANELESEALKEATAKNTAIRRERKIARKPSGLAKPPKKEEEKPLGSVICFLASSRLQPNIGYSTKLGEPPKKEPSKKPEGEGKTDGEQTSEEEAKKEETTNNDVYCFPLAAQMVPTVSYREEDKTEKAEAEAKAEPSITALSEGFGNSSGLQGQFPGTAPLSPAQGMVDQPLFQGPSQFQGNQYAIPNSQGLPYGSGAGAAMAGGGVLNFGGYPTGLGQPLSKPGAAGPRNPASNFGQPYAYPKPTPWPNQGPNQGRPANPSVLLQPR